MGLQKVLASEDQYPLNRASNSIRFEMIQTTTSTKHRIAKMTALLIVALTVLSARTQSQDLQSPDAYSLVLLEF